MITTWNYPKLIDFNKVQIGDIYLVKCYPSTGGELRKIRPAIVIQNEEITKKSSLVTVVPMSSQIYNHMSEDDFVVERDSRNRLMHDSIVMVRHISSFDKSRFLRKVGTANSPTLRKVRGYLRKHFML